MAPRPSQLSLVIRKEHDVAKHNISVPLTMAADVDASRFFVLPPDSLRRTQTAPVHPTGVPVVLHRSNSSLPTDSTVWGEAPEILSSPALTPFPPFSNQTPPEDDDWKLAGAKCSLVRRNARRSSVKTPPKDQAMANSLLNPRIAGSKLRAMQEAQEAQKVVEERAARTGKAAPHYDFLELIGKGSFGRVYKGKNRNTNAIVAIKILEVDKADYNESHDHRDEAVTNFMKETSILRTLKDSGAQNINMLHDTFSVHSTLWIVSDYCPGGSVRTLCRANPNSHPNRPGPLEEKFIIPIARELAIALQSTHQAGIVHRDLKCANVLIREDGCLQLCDFGVAGVLPTNMDRRATIIGTPHWMPPEMIREDIGFGYGFEVDIWEYGCTIFEMATGMPPNATTAIEDLGSRTEAPRFQSNKHSQALSDFIAFCLKPRPEERPSAEDILDHPYIAGSEEQYPTQSLVELIERFKEWESRGGNRSSLWHEGGAATLDPLNPQAQADDDWIFSTTADFDRKFAEQKGLSEDPFRDHGVAADSAAEDKQAAPAGRRRNFALQQKAMKENQIRRGGEAMERLFNPAGPEYQYNERFQPMQPPPRQPFQPSQAGVDRSSNVSDLALRNYGGDRASNRITMIDLDFGFVDVDVPDISAAPTIRASRFNRPFEAEDDDYTYQPNRESRRATKDWKFPWSTDPQPQETNRKTMDWTFASAETSNNGNQDFRNSKIAQRRLTKDQQAPMRTAPIDERRSFLPGFSFPMAPAEDNGPGPRTSLQPSPPLGTAFRPQLRHAATQPIGNFDDFYMSQSAPESPNRESMIDLDFADVTLVPRPATAMDYPEPTRGPEAPPTAENSFDLEDQRRLSKNNNRTSYHQKSQSAPQHRVSLLQPQGDDSYNQGYVSDNGPALQSRDRQSRMLNGSTRSSAVPEPERYVPPHLVNQRLRDPSGAPIAPNGGALPIPNGTVRGRRNVSNTSGAPTSQPYITYSYGLDDTPPSTSGGSFSSSNFASPETALAANEDLTQLTTPRTSIATYSPRSAISNFTQQSYDSRIDGARPMRSRLTLRAAPPMPPNPAALEISASPQLMANEASRAAQQHVMYLKTLQHTLKMCGSQAQARRAGRRPRLNSNGDSTVAVSSVESSDAEGSVISGTVRRVLRRTESSVD